MKPRKSESPPRRLLERARFDRRSRIALGVGIALSYAGTYVLRTTETPWIAGACGTAGLIGLTVAARSRFGRTFALTLTAVLFALTALEWGVSTLRTASGRSRKYSAGFFREHPWIGTAGPRNTTAWERRKRDGREVFHVEYKFDKNGQRPSFPAPNAEVTLLCFGGSFMFGEGIKDEETTAYRVGQRSGGRVRVYNFAFPGHGSHQMLSALEHGVVKDIVKPAGRVHAVYWAMPDHIRRSAGYASWDYFGPRYVLEDGRPTFTGQFRDRFWRRYFHRSTLYRRYWLRLGGAGESECALYLAIAKESAARLAGLYDQTGFQQVYWSDKRWNHHEAMRSLAERTAVHPMTDVLPQDVPVEEFLIPGDGHPNARCHDMLAAYIVEHLLGPG
ncbi:MAG: hypothetical protein V3T86_06605 [Planctomycetota bacterium]